MPRVEARLLKGFEDHLPARALRRQQAIDAIRPIFELFGFCPLETPAVEHLDVLLGSGGEESNKELFRFESPEEEPVALRFDLTVPFARVLAQYGDEIKLPFRRYAIGPVFRADKPGPGRFRQFTQVDFDAAGSNDVAVDAEIAAVLCRAMESLSFADYRLEINSRRVVDAMLAGCGIAEIERQKHVLRVVDKLNKVGLDAVRAELGDGRMDESGDRIRGVGLSPGQIDRICAFLAVKGETRSKTIDALEAFLEPSKQRDEALAELRELDANLGAMGVGTRAVFDPSLARGLDYYTGPVFEMKLPQAPQLGTVAAGGRYDRLVERFTPNAITATGASFGLDRLVAALEFLSPDESRITPTRVLITTFKGVPKAHYLAIAEELRAAGIPAEVFFGKRSAKLTDQLSWANLRGIPVAVVAGEDELAKGEVSIKDLRAGAAARAGLADHDAYLAAGKAGQETVDRTALLARIRELLRQ